jgi:hypothetical protein
MRTDNPTLISAMRELAATVQCDDGIANAAIAEAADRLEELHAEKAAIVAELERLASDWHQRSLQDAKSDLIAPHAFSSGICSGLSLARKVVQAGGALPPERSEEGK